jgi:hypothetical protein
MMPTSNNNVLDLYKDPLEPKKSTASKMFLFFWEAGDNTLIHSQELLLYFFVGELRLQ